MELLVLVGFEEGLCLVVLVCCRAFLFLSFFFSSRRRIQHGFSPPLLLFGRDAMPFEVVGAAVH